MSLIDEMEQDSTELAGFQTLTDADIASVGQLARDQIRLEKELEEAEEDLKKAKEALAKVKDVELPNALKKFGLSEIKLTDGSSVTIKEEIYTGITEQNQAAAFDWLTKTGNEGLIKNEVKSTFGKGQEQAAKEYVTLLTDRGFSFTNKKSVHPMTLKSFVKHRLEAGEEVPVDIFSLHVKKVATVKKGK